MTKSISLKYLSVIILFSICNLTCFAQMVQKLEGEASLGFTVPLGNYHNGDKLAGPDFGLEVRYNIPHTAWDCGLALNVSTAVYKFDESPKTDWYWEQSNRSINIMAVGDYNFKQGSKFNPYLGMGLGLCSYDAVNEVLYKESGIAFVFRPRIGIELFRHLRLAVFTNITKVGHSNFGVSIGGVIGGRPKK
ncbi:MAG: hypothetical protein HDT07_02660 [Bacteroidales bacterium]|nr:hypothetical protein [Bacteroidales bacterium]